MKNSAQLLAVAIFVLAIAVVSASSISLLRAQVTTTTGGSSSSSSSIYIPPRLCVTAHNVTYKITSFSWGIVPGKTTTTVSNGSSSSQSDLINLSVLPFVFNPGDIVDVTNHKYQPLTIQKPTDAVGTRTLYVDADTGFKLNSVKLTQTAGTDKPGFTMEFKKAIVVLPFLQWGGADGAMEQATFNFNELGTFTFTPPLGPNARTGSNACPP